MKNNTKKQRSQVAFIFNIPLMGVSVTSQFLPSQFHQHPCFLVAFAVLELLAFRGRKVLNQGCQLKHLPVTRITLAHNPT